MRGGASAISNAVRLPGDRDRPRDRGRARPIPRPESIPAGMELKSRSLGDRASYMVAPRSKGSLRSRLPATHGEVLSPGEGRLLREGYRQGIARICRAVAWSSSRGVDGVETVESCEWNPDGVISVGFVSDGHSVIAAAPAGSFLRTSSWQLRPRWWSPPRRKRAL